MSDTNTDATGSMGNEARDSGGQLLDAQGRPMPQARQTGKQARQTGKQAQQSGQQVRQPAQQAQQRAEGLAEEVGEYVRQQPVSAALLALAVGYIVGRLRII